MHLLIPFASGLSDAANQVLHDLTLPNLSQLLARFAPTLRLGSDATTLTPPHELAEAAAFGWEAADGCLPFAAAAARADGIEVGDAAWGLITPAHWHVGRDHVVLADPGALQLGAAESRAAFEAVRELFESEGFRLQWGAPERWYVAHESLADWPTASLDRVIGRDVESWSRTAHAPAASARLIRRLQSEVQLLLYPHPLNEAREARGAPTLNSFWLSGCGRAQAVREGDAPSLRIDTSLRAPLLADDWLAWADAWRALDAGALAELAAVAQAHQPAALTLCGERHAQRYEARPPSAWQRLTQRFTHVAPHTVLEPL